MNSARLNEYLNTVRITPAPDQTPDLALLQTILSAHMNAFPFQSLSTVLNEPIRLDGDALFDKIVRARRGGYCYELNLLLSNALTALGYSVKPLTGNIVHDNQPDRSHSRTHMLLEVALDGDAWIVDSGFGGLCPTAPLRLDSTETQTLPHGAYRITPHHGRYILNTFKNGEWRMLYIFDRLPQHMVDLEVGNWFVSTHPQSPFRSRLMAARALPDGSRHTLLNRRHTFHRADGSSDTVQLNNAAELIQTLEKHFHLAPPSADSQACIQTFLDQQPE